MANTKDNEKEKARELYFTTAMSQSEIAGRVGVSEKTMSAWAIEGNWRNVYHDYDLSVPADFNTTPPETKTPQTSISQ